jgi:hypothetical protein
MMMMTLMMMRIAAQHSCCLRSRVPALHNFLGPHFVTDKQRHFLQENP